MQSLFLDLWNSVRRAQISVKRDRDTAAEGSSAQEASAPQKRQKLADVSSHPPTTADTGSALCCLYQLKPAVTPHGLISGQNLVIVEFSTMQYLNRLPGKYAPLDLGPCCSQENDCTPAMLRQAS